MMSKNKLKAANGSRDLQWPIKLFACRLFPVLFHHKGLTSRTPRLMITSYPAPDENWRKGIYSKTRLPLDKFGLKERDPNRPLLSKLKYTKN